MWFIFQAVSIHYSLHGDTLLLIYYIQQIINIIYKYIVIN